MKRGWCPGLHSPMPSGDGLLLRILPPGGVLTATAARSVADVAARYGNGAIALTPRARLQLRGFTPESAAVATSELLAAGLGEADPVRERRRRAIGPPLLGDDSGIAAGTGGVLARLQALLLRDATLDALPEKFLFVVDGGGVLPLDHERAEVLLRVRDGQVTVRTADAEVIRTTARAAEVALSLARQARARPPAPPLRPAPCGFIAYPGTTYPRTNRGAFAATPPLGRLDAALLHALADLADRFGDGTLRATPWRCLLLPRVTAPAPLTRAAAALGLIVDPADARLRVVACAGRPACPSATVDAAEDALRLAPSLPAGEMWHISGCAKLCAHAGAAAVTLIGEAGRYRRLKPQAA